MTSTLEIEANETSRGIRIAIEGCGHGTLDAIYASIMKSCDAKGWDGVDLVIIGGDFQAVRDKKDLNVTAMPAKYRKMADFHQYYWGTKTAPFLTVFVGGNHEASNHLFELYYGGWVAPSIYYLGAASVIQVGPLKIAGMSGIWKGYDYRKPHYERLPYSQDDMYSIYHVRELDVRKLLSFRSQVDIGISHDWPKGIEWSGDHVQLFRHKPHLQEDAKSGKLGNTAAQKVMDRLRPPYWFSAHLHTKYTAIKRYTMDKENMNQTETAQIQPPQKLQPNLPLQSLPHQEQLSAWNNFGVRARKEEADETAQMLKAEELRREEAERTGKPITANYVLNETYKKVRIGNGLTREISSVSHNEENSRAQEQRPQLSQLDGSCASLPLKRQREESTSPGHQSHPSTRYAAIGGVPNDGTALPPLDHLSATNPDAIDIDMSSDDDDNDQNTRLTLDNEDGDESYTAAEQMSFGLTSTERSNGVRDSAATQSDSTEVKNKDMTTIQESADNSGQLNALKSNIMDTDPDMLPLPQNGQPGEKPTNGPMITEEQQASGDLNNVSDEMRAQLAALSSKFEEPIQVSPSLPHPDGIRNETTRFLALSKCEDKQNFLQLLEIEPHDVSTTSKDYPLKLRYVPEWLAILRVFAPELVLGGSPKDSVSQHRGDTYYRERIIEEEKWVQQNVVGPGHLLVPENFTTITPIDNTSTLVDDRDMPRETTNPQTSQFCKLIGIENPFDISEEERDSRMAAGPAESAQKDRNDHGGRGGRGGRGGSHNRGGRGRGNRGWGGRGRGRQ